MKFSQPARVTTEPCHLWTALVDLAAEHPLAVVSLARWVVPPDSLVAVVVLRAQQVPQALAAQQPEAAAGGAAGGLGALGALGGIAAGAGDSGDDPVNNPDASTPEVVGP